MMNKKIAIIISPNWHDYAEKYLEDCLNSIARLSLPSQTELFLIDNESSDASYQYLLSKAESLINEILPFTIIRNQANDGFAKGNNQALKQALVRGFDYLVLFNMDTVIDRMAVEELVKAADSDDLIGAVQARLMLYPEKTRINSLGNCTHFLGFGFSEGNGEVYHENLNQSDVKEIFYPSGAAVLFKAEALKNVGMFDEEFWMYAEDQDLGWRIWLAGYKCVLAGKAIVYHKYEFSKSIKKFYWMDRNRILVILKNYKWPTIFLILPALGLMELGLLLFALKGGWLKHKLGVYAYFLNLKNYRQLFRSRQSIQKSRKIKDRQIAIMMKSRIDYQEISSPVLELANWFFASYWRVIIKLINW